MCTHGTARIVSTGRRNVFDSTDSISSLLPPTDLRERRTRDRNARNLAESKTRRRRTSHFGVSVAGGRVYEPYFFFTEGARNHNFETPI